MSFSRRGLIAGIVVLAVVTVCVRLGIWQLNRLEQRRDRNIAFKEALALPVLELSGARLAAVSSDPMRYRYRRVRIRGEPLTGAEVVWRGRSARGRPGVNLLTPIRVEGGDTAVLVNRGWAPSPDGTSVDVAALAEPNVREVVGVAIPLPELPAGGRPRVLELQGERVLSVQGPDRSTVIAALPLPLAPIYVQQLPAAGDPPLPARLDLPDLGSEGPHLGYAIQWFSFALIAAVGYLVLLGRKSGPA